MALIKCVACNAEVSDKGDACPKCGQKFKARPKPKNSPMAEHSRIGVYLFAAVLLSLLLALAWLLWFTPLGGRILEWFRA